MDSRIRIIEQIKSDGLLPLYFYPDAAKSFEILKALYDGGIRVIEYTNRGKQALQNFEFMKKQANQFPDLLLGAGTIKDASSANQFIQAGADFLISPGIPEDVFDVTYENKVLWIPGCMTVTEIIKAENFGLSFVKIFPGNLLGPSFIQSIKDIFPDFSFMPTGGVEPEEKNLKAWFDAGVSAVGMGSKMVTNKMMEQGHYKKITAAAKETLRIISDVRRK
jgi:2-dehydro-3-deoxyphosphogluconate aldolase/(4S)-4-hydroxy-2-oxoglutarate aldolase